VVASSFFSDTQSLLRVEGMEGTFLLEAPITIRQHYSLSAAALLDNPNVYSMFQAVALHGKNGDVLQTMRIGQRSSILTEIQGRTITATRLDDANTA